MTDIDRNSPIPLYHQLKTLIREQIESGVWRPGERIPTEQDLCQLYHISRSPVRQALNELAREGLLGQSDPFRNRQGIQGCLGPPGRPGARNPEPSLRQATGETRAVRCLPLRDLREQVFGYPSPTSRSLSSVAPGTVALATLARFRVPCAAGLERRRGVWHMLPSPADLLRGEVE